jgi:thiamine pyrophosphokinase
VVAALHALVVADGEPGDREAIDASWPGWAHDIGLVIAADGGVRHVDALGLVLDRWVGDGDSIEPDRLAALRAAGFAIDVAPRDKDESDAELAVLAALDAGATELTILGALGGTRLDHEIANLSLLAHPGLRGRPARLLAHDARVSLVDAPGPDGGPVDRAIAGRAGDLVSLLPFGAGVEGVTTRGLRYPLRDEPLPAGPARGLSNIREVEAAGLSVRHGLLLVIETPANLGR